LKIILGIGNPGLRYKFSRHNLGFLVVEALAKENKIKLTRKNYNYLFGQASVDKQRLVLVKPLSFVNRSGEAAALIIKQKKIDLKDLLIVCDDINLPLGKIRIRGTGSEGGHNGLRSIIQSLGSKDFPRLRIGVDRAGVELSRHVLGRFKRAETKIITEAIERSADCCRVWLSDGIAVAMDRFN